MRPLQKRHFRPSAMPALLVLALMAGLGAGPLAAAALTEELDETYPLPAGGQLTLDNVNGDIEVAVWDRNEVRIQARKRVRAASRSKAEAALDELHIEIHRRGDVIDIETRHPQRSGFWDWLSSGHVSAQVDYQLTVPKQITLDLATTNGKVTGQGTRGKLSVRTTNGNVEFEGGGQASVRTTNGSIRVELENVTPGSSLSFSTTNGGIRLALPSTMSASIRASTTNGSISTELPIKVEGQLSRNHLQGEITGSASDSAASSSLALRTTNGSIRISEI